MKKAVTVQKPPQQSVPGSIIKPNFQLPNKFKQQNFKRPAQFMRVRSFGGHK